MNGGGGGEKAGERNKSLELSVVATLSAETFKH